MGQCVGDIAVGECQLAADLPGDNRIIPWGSTALKRLWGATFESCRKQVFTPPNIWNRLMCWRSFSHTYRTGRLMNRGTLHYIGVLRCFRVSEIQAMQDLAGR